MARGWTWLDGDTFTENPVIVAQIEVVVARINTLNRLEEDRHEAMSFYSEDSRDWPEDDEEEEEEEEDGEEALAKARSEHEERKQAQVTRADKDKAEATIREKELENYRDMLKTLGARMMRPYEHHNEDERHYEYMESRYDNCYGDY